MTKKHSVARRRAFLTYLAQTGNQTLSAERACVSCKWVQRTRASDPHFDAAYRQALEAAKERFGSRPLTGRAHVRAEQGHPLPPPARGRGEREAEGRGIGGCKPPPSWEFLDGAELVVAGSNGRYAQVRRARPKQWTPRAEKRFLSALASTCNVHAACAEVGRAVSSAYDHRRRWPLFERAWAKAEETGYLRLEAALIAAAAGIGEEPEFEPDLPIEGMTVWHAMQLLHMHRHQVHGVGGRPGAPPSRRLATDEEMVKALTRSLRQFGCDVDKGLRRSSASSGRKEQ